MVQIGYDADAGKKLFNSSGQLSLCPESAATPCTACTGDTPFQVELTVTGIEDDICLVCESDANGVFILEQISTELPCEWRGYIGSNLCTTKGL